MRTICSILETKLFPPHNIEGTAGRELYGKIKAFIITLVETVIFII